MATRHALRIAITSSSSSCACVDTVSDAHVDIANHRRSPCQCRQCRYRMHGCRCQRRTPSRSERPLGDDSCCETVRLSSSGAWRPFPSSKRHAAEDQTTARAGSRPRGRKPSAAREFDGIGAGFPLIRVGCSAVTARQSFWRMNETNASRLALGPYLAGVVRLFVRLERRRPARHDGRGELRRLDNHHGWYEQQRGNIRGGW